MTVYCTADVSPAIMRKVVAVKLPVLRNREFADRILGTAFCLGKSEFRQGDTVNVLIGDPVGQDAASACVTDSVPYTCTGIVIGTANQQNDTHVVIDRGCGCISAVQLSKIVRMGHSTAAAAPSSGKFREKVVLNMHGFIAAMGERIIPSAAGTCAAAWAGWMVLEQAQALASLSLLHTVGVCIAAGSAYLTSGIDNCFKLSYRLGKAAGVLAVQLARIIFHIDELVSRIGTGLRYRAFQRHDAQFSSGNRGKGSGEYAMLHDSDGIRMYLIDRKEAGPEETAGLEEAFHHMQAVRSYLCSVGMPVTEERCTVWVRFSPFRFFNIGPYACGRRHWQIVVAPFVLPRDTAGRREDDRGSVIDPARARMAVTDKTVYGHELVHVMMGYMLGGGLRKVLGGMVTEALADYFSVSAVNEDPLILNGACRNGLPLREGVRRDDVQGRDYPAHLNVNSVAQVYGDTHKSSQLVFRMLWELRGDWGRELIDRLIVQAVKDMAGMRKGIGHKRLAFGKLKGARGVHGKMYMFMAALARAMSEEAGKAQALQQSLYDTIERYDVLPEVVRLYVEALAPAEKDMSRAIDAIASGVPDQSIIVSTSIGS